MATEQPKPLPFIANFAAGAIAGVSEILTFYPLDVVKTRMQLETGKAKHGMVGTLTSIIREEGAGKLYRGLVPPLLTGGAEACCEVVSRSWCQPHLSSVSFRHSAANDFWGKTYMNFAGESKMTQQLSILTGCSAGATESIVVVPFELVKIKLQDKMSTFAGPLDVVKQVIKKEGVLGLYGGMEATFWRHVWWNGGYFGCIHQVRSIMPKAETPQAQLFNNFVSGATGGFVGTVLNTPHCALVVKSRIQGASKVPGVVPKYNWTYPALLTIMREEGPAALYKGFLPKVLRLAPGGGVLLLVVEFTLGVFRQALGPPYI
ncbi:mitochondrial carrier [Melanogaster broomeanus]|nr:mitochondrial carrier [Melanogaster broomeanus]